MFWYVTSYFNSLSLSFNNTQHTRILFNEKVLTMKGIVRVWGQGWAACCEKNTDQKLDETEPVMELRSEKVVQVAAGSNHSMALTDRGLLFTWGSGKMGELGLGIDVDGK